MDWDSKARVFQQYGIYISNWNKQIINKKGKDGRKKILKQDNNFIIIVYTY
jgi:hypothetical protein